MKFSRIFARAFTGLKQAKVRTLLTSVAISVGGFAIAASLAAGEGARDYTQKIIGSNINPQSLFIVKDKSLFDGSSREGSIRKYDEDIATTNGSTIKQLTQKDIEKLREREDIKNVIPIYQPSMKYFTVGEKDDKYITDVSSYDYTIDQTTLHGSLPQKGVDIKSGEIVVPESFAEALVEQKQVSSKSNLVGKKITLTFTQSPKGIDESEIMKILQSEGPAGLAKLSEGTEKDFELTVVAVTKKSELSLGGSSEFAVSEKDAMEMNNFITEGTKLYQKYFGAIGMVEDGVEPMEVKNKIEEQGYAAQTAEDLQQLIFTFVNLLQAIVAGFGVLALIASIFGIINTMYISVLERTGQIGLMKALGMRGRAVLLMFVIEAGLIGLIGGVIGIGLAYLAGWYLNPIITENLSLGEGQYLLMFESWQMAALLSGLVLVATLSGVLPARRAAKLDPINALRTE